MSPSHERKTNIKENNSKWAPKPSTYYKHTGAPNVNTIKKNNLLDKHWVKPGVKCKRCSQGVASCISFVVFAWVAVISRAILSMGFALEYLLVLVMSDAIENRSN